MRNVIARVKLLTFWQFFIILSAYICEKLWGSLDLFILVSSKLLENVTKSVLGNCSVKTVLWLKSIGINNTHY